MLRQALRADLPLIHDIWTDAFAGDPFLTWMCGDSEWPAFAADWFDFIAGLCFERGHTYVAERDDAAVAWIPPDLSMVGPGDLDRGAAIIERHGGADRSRDAVQTILAAREHGLDESHWTLQYIGVRAARRGQGLGADLVAARLAECTREGLPCALISSNPANVPFYRRLGFEIDAEVWTPDRAASLRAMTRR